MTDNARPTTMANAGFNFEDVSKIDYENLTTVFYLKKPVTQGDEGALAFKFGEEQYAYQPKEGEFVVFPASYMHSPLPIHTEEYRMAININIVTLNSYKDFL